ncbi:hypothetical protein C0T31_07845 [Dysgonamonadaceae bacterium]|nr:hypothetical protein C0T31_07845 [Dysgonamonadaceae bacterium]
MKKEVFDYLIFDKLDDRSWWHKEAFKDAVEQLKKEGLPTTLEFIQKITKDENSLRDFVNEEQRKRLSGGFVPNAEREFVHEAFVGLYERLQKKIADLRNALNGSLVIKADGDTVEIDEDAMQEKLKKAATIEIDAVRGEEYYKKFMEVVSAWQSLCEYEKKNNFPQIIRRLEFHDLIPFDFPLGRDGTISESTFAYALRNWLKKRSKQQSGLV